MRKRAQARKQVNHDDMWITVPRSPGDEAEAASDAVVHPDAPTYEDAWYRVLRKADGDPASTNGSREPAPEAAAAVVTEVGPDELEGDVTSEEETATGSAEVAGAHEATADDVEPPAVAEPSAEPEIPARPDRMPQHASSLD